MGNLDEIKYMPVEKRAIEILREYNGNNNFLIILKNRVNRGNISLGRKNSDYVVKNYNKKVIGINKWFDIDSYYGEELQKRFLLIEKPKKIFISKILSDTDKAIHVWGKVWEDQNMCDMWIPKHSIIKPKKTNKVELVDDNWKKYERKPFKHQVEGITKLMEYDRFILADDMGLGKMEWVENQLFTPTGRKRIGDIKIGDQVIGSDGKPCNVIGVYPQGVKELYKVTFNDNYSILVGGEHLWAVSLSSKNKNKYKKTYVLSTQQLLDTELKIKTNGVGHNEKKSYFCKTYYKQTNGNLRWQIPIVNPIEFTNNTELPIDPYLLGLMLGDGNIKETKINFTTHKDDYDDLFNGYDIKELNKDKKRPNIRKGVIKCNELKNLQLNNTYSHNKFIPEIYKYSSIENRLELIRGLFDTDGYRTNNKKIRNKNSATGTFYYSVSEKLVDDVAEIIHSLGGIVKKSSKQGSYKKNGVKVICKKVFILNIKLPTGIVPFKLKRKAENYKFTTKYLCSRYIKKIELEDKREAVCIAVDSPDKLYVTEHAIVTHNTTQAIMSAIECDAKKILIVCPASLKLNWEKEIRIYDKTGTINIISGSEWISGGKWTIINYDILKNFHTVRDKRKKDQFLITNIIDEGFDLVIGDECHYCKNRDSQRTKIFNDFTKDIKRLWLLTGTPVTNRPIDYYNLLDLCKHRLARSWVGYVLRYCAGKQFYGRGRRKIWDTKGSSNLDELHENTQDVILRRRKEEVLDLPEKIIQPIYLPLNNPTEYKKIVGEYQSWAEHQENFNLALHLAQLVKLRQFLALSKIESTIEIAENAIEEGKKVIIFTNFTEPLLLLHNHFGKKSVIHHGPMTKSQREESIERFQNDPTVNVFIGNIISAGIGITLTAAELVIFNDLSWLPADHLQAQDRAHRIGQKKVVNVYYNIIDETLDLHLFEALMTKMKIIDQIMGDNNTDDDMFKSVIQKLHK